MSNNKRKGFTLVEVLVAVIIFAFGILSMAAFAALNYMYLRANQAKAKLHVLNESMVDDIQNWMREPTGLPANGPTRFDSLYNGAYLGGSPARFDTIRRVISPGSLSVAVVTWDTFSGTAPHQSDAKIFLQIDSWITSGTRTVFETMDFAVANYGMGE